MKENKEETQLRSAEEIIQQTVGIKLGADKFTPMDYGECIACLNAYASQFKKGDQTEQRLPLNFWKRLEMFVSEVQVNDPMSEEEKEMILRVSAQNKGNSR